MCYWIGDVLCVFLACYWYGDVLCVSLVRYWYGDIGANGPRFAGTVPIFGALSPLTYKNFYCGPRFHRLWEYWRVFKNMLVLLIFDSTQNQLS